MKTNLWNTNHPRNFWQCQPDVSEEIWQTAIVHALPVLGLVDAQSDMDTILALTLGEARFGPGHWTLSLPKRMYYFLKPVLPRVLTRVLRRMYSNPEKINSNIQWPIEPRYVNFLWETMAQLLQVMPNHELCIKPFWPGGFRYALVLTHDIESNAGQGFVRAVADLEEWFGFRSSFNFVPEGYPVDMALVDELRQRGFEIGIHGLTHDGKLFNSRAKFERGAKKINRYLRDLGAVGFRAPLTIRNPEWMQSLNMEIEYDLSFFDTDPFEPIPGGTMSIWPFFLGHFVELPYTLVQDYTLTSILSETSPRIWLEKIDFIQAYRGMALVNTHPDYLRNETTLSIYREFLQNIKDRQESWNALPQEAAAWWCARADGRLPSSNDNLITVRLIDDGLEFKQTSGTKPSANKLLRRNENETIDHLFTKSIY
jgi:peptidoglycan/xylan/chitin deacetylase (PgdA/CDA1 family)